MVGPSTGQQPESETDRTNRKDIAIATMEARIESLETQLTAKDQQIDQLHHLLAQTGPQPSPTLPFCASPAPGPRPWEM